MTTQMSIIPGQVMPLDVLGLATEIVSSYVAHNKVESSELTNLINQVYSSLSEIAAGRTSMANRPEPAVSIRKSVTDDYIICLEDGKKLKMLKRHLKSAYNITPEQYRERWGLPSDYPMVAPKYAEQRSQLAKNIGLGTSSRRKKKLSIVEAA